MTLEELEKEFRKEQKGLVEMYESGKYTSEELVKKSQRVDPFVSEIMRRMLDKNKNQYKGV